MNAWSFSNVSACSGVFERLRRVQVVPASGASKSNRPGCGADRWNQVSNSGCGSTGYEIANATATRALSGGGLSGRPGRGDLWVSGAEDFLEGRLGNGGGLITGDGVFEPAQIHQDRTQIAVRLGQLRLQPQGILTADQRRGVVAAEHEHPAATRERTVA